MDGGKYADIPAVAPPAEDEDEASAPGPAPDPLPNEKPLDRGGGWKENGEMLSANDPAVMLSNPDSPPGPNPPCPADVYEFRWKTLWGKVPVLGGPCDGTTWIPFPRAIDSGMTERELAADPRTTPPIGAPAVLGLGYP